MTRSTNPADPRRCKAMRKLVAKNWTLQAIGDQYGISRERVRQIVGNVGYERRSTAQKKLRESLGQVLKLWANGENFSAISLETKVPLHAIQSLHLPRNPAPLVHGTASCYSYHGCRCPECRAANAKRTRDRHGARRRNGLCIQCGAPSPDTWRCRACANHNANRAGKAGSGRGSKRQK